MTPDISEFSYGFALTQELIKIADPLRAAPIFPSLIEEGRAGGGYDVNLDIPGFPLFIQFKRSDCMKRRSAREAAPPFNLNPPFYRMKITERSRSAQHEMLLDLDDGTNEVFYAAPLFHTVEELNAAYGSVTVSEESFYLRNSKIGRLDNESHHVAFDRLRLWVCSEPREIEGISGRQLPEVLRDRLASDDRPLRRGRLPDALAVVEHIVQDRKLSPTFWDAPAAERDHDIGALQRLADLSLRYFNTQLFIVQRREDGRERP